MQLPLAHTHVRKTAALAELKPSPAARRPFVCTQSIKNATVSAHPGMLAARGLEPNPACRRAHAAGRIGQAGGHAPRGDERGGKKATPQLLTAPPRRSRLPRHCRPRPRHPPPRAVLGAARRKDKRRRVSGRHRTARPAPVSAHTARARLCGERPGVPRGAGRARHAKGPVGRAAGTGGAGGRRGGRHWQASRCGHRRRRLGPRRRTLLAPAHPDA